MRTISIVLVFTGRTISVSLKETTCLFVGCCDHNMLLSDENGPRPPPFLNMWPAEAIGDVHRIVSDAGKW
jgi:hypothetical protein